MCVQQKGHGRTQVCACVGHGLAHNNNQSEPAGMAVPALIVVCVWLLRAVLLAAALLSHGTVSSVVYAALFLCLVGTSPYVHAPGAFVRRFACARRSGALPTPAAAATVTATAVTGTTNDGSRGGGASGGNSRSHSINGRSGGTGGSDSGGGDGSGSGDGGASSLWVRLTWVGVRPVGCLVATAVLWSLTVLLLHALVDGASQTPCRWLVRCPISTVGSGWQHLAPAGGCLVLGALVLVVQVVWGPGLSVAHTHGRGSWGAAGSGPGEPHSLGSVLVQGTTAVCVLLVLTVQPSVFSGAMLAMVALVALGMTTVAHLRTWAVTLRLLRAFLWANGAFLMMQ
jgi:hypothetical protein